MLTYDTAQEARGHHDDALRLAVATVTQDLAAELQRLNKQLETDPEALPRQQAARTRLTNIITLLRAIEAKEKFSDAERKMLEGMVGHGDLLLEAMVGKYKGLYEAEVEQNATLSGLLLASYCLPAQSPLPSKEMRKARKSTIKIIRGREDRSDDNQAA